METSNAISKEIRDIGNISRWLFVSLSLSLGQLYLPTHFSACITSIIRIYYAVRLSHTGDMAYNFAVLGLWSHAEITCGIICGCLPVLPRFFLTLRPKIWLALKSCVQIQNTPRRFGLSGQRGNGGSSGYTGKGPYELQRDWHSSEVYGLGLTGKQSSTVTSSAADTNVRSLAPIMGDPTLGLESVGGAPGTNRILKTVHIETVQEPRDDSDLDVEMQSSISR